MKNINLFLTILITLGILTSCEDDPRGPVIGVFNAPQITAPSGGSFILTEETEEDVMTTFTWSHADFGFQAEVTYTVEMDEAGNDFAEPMELASTFTSQAAVTVGKVNNLLLSAGYPFGVESDFEVRVIAEVHEDVDLLYSTSVSLAITPFEKIVIYPMLWTPGSYQGWAPDASPNLYSLKSNNKYEGYINFPDPNNELKFTDAPDWNNGIYGDADASGTTGTIDPDSDGNNVKIAEAGYYKVNVDLVNFTYAFLKTDWGLIGDATPGGWDSDQNMTYDVTTKVWSVTVDLVPGKIKFRANDGWDLNYGSNNANGICDAGGTDIPIAEGGNYTVVLDLNGPLYRYTLTKN